MAVKTLECTALTRWRWFSAVGLARTGELPPAMMKRQNLLNRLAFTNEEKAQINYREQEDGAILFDVDAVTPVDLTGPERKALRGYILSPASPWLVGAAGALLDGAKLLDLQMQSADNERDLETIVFSRGELLVMIKQLAATGEHNLNVLYTKYRLLEDLRNAWNENTSVLVFSKWVRQTLIAALEQPQAAVEGAEIPYVLSALQKLGYVPDPIAEDEDEDDE